VTQRDYYLALALELLARADGEPDPERRAGLEALAASYRRMAEQAPHEAGRIIDVELPIEETKPLRNRQLADMAFTTLNVRFWGKADMASAGSGASIH
jgi:hypothetical protein